MEYAHYEVGRYFDGSGDPLFVVDGKILGTVEGVKDVIRRYEDSVSESIYEGVADEVSEWLDDHLKWISEWRRDIDERLSALESLVNFHGTSLAAISANDNQRHASIARLEEKIESDHKSFKQRVIDTIRSASRRGVKTS